MGDIRDVFETVDVPNAIAFLDYLQPRADRWHPKGPGKSPWVFRGQGNADWPLTPSAWRSDTPPWFRNCVQSTKERVVSALDKAVEFVNKSGGAVPVFNRERLLALGMGLAAEYLVIDDFLDLADELGEPVPDQRHEAPYLDIFTGFAWQLSARPDTKQPSDLFSYQATTATALAQHHGVPTRLLDFSRAPFKAAFFAAEASHLHRYERIAVWAIRLDVVRHPPFQDVLPIEKRFRVLLCPRSALSYLHHQDGLFIYPDHGDRHMLMHGSRPLLEECVALMTPPDWKVPVLRKITLPAEEAPKLLELLWRERITRAHLMRTFDNVTQTIKYRYEQ